MSHTKRLTDIKVKALKPKMTRYLIPDGEGLNLAISPKGLKSWVLRYRFNGKADSLTIGKYGTKSDELSLSQARFIKNNVKLLLDKGIEPKQYKNLLSEESILKAIQDIVKTEIKMNANSSSLTFGELYDEFCGFKTAVFGKNKAAWEYGTLKKHNERFNKYVLPKLSDSPLCELTEDDLEDCLLNVQSFGALASRDKIRTVFNGMFDYAKGKKYIDRNIAKYVSDSLFIRRIETHYKHVTTKEELQEIANSLDSLRATYEVKQCLRLGFLLFVRPSEVSQLKWAHVDFNSRMITKPADTMRKNGREFLIPLSKQSLEVLKEIYPLTGHTDFVFYSPYGTGKAISTDSLSNALKRNGIFEINPHGFRHTASTMLNEFGFDKDAIELQLSHVIGGVRGIYNKAQKIEERRHMMQFWADLLDEMKL